MIGNIQGLNGTYVILKCLNLLYDNFFLLQQFYIILCHIVYNILKFIEICLRSNFPVASVVYSHSSVHGNDTARSWIIGYRFNDHIYVHLKIVHLFTFGRLRKLA